MRRGSAVVFVSLALMVAGCGCGPMAVNRIAVSPDGKTLYMSLNADGGLEVDASSCLYALDVDKGRLRALSGESAPQGWFSVSSNGRLLAFHEGGFEGAQITVLDLSKRRSSCISATDRMTILPSFVPGERGYVIAAELDLKAPEARSKWVAFREGKRFELLSTQLQESDLFTALARNKALFVVRKVIEEKTEQKPGKAEVEIYLVDFSGDTPGQPLCVGRWESPDSLWALPILSADGGRIAAMVWTEAQKGARVLDIDPRNMRPPKLLFEGETGLPVPVSFTPDGKGMVILSADLLGTCDVKVWNEADGKQRVIARLPEAGMDCIIQRPVWMGPAQVRLVAPSEAGLHVIDVNLDGRQAEDRVLSWHKLHVQRCLADVEWGIEHGRPVVERKRPPKKQPFVPLLPGEKPEENKPPEPKPDPEAERAEKERAAVNAELAPVLGVLKARDDELAKLIEAEWDKVDDWEKVPVLDPEPAAP